MPKSLSIIGQFNIQESDDTVVVGVRGVDVLFIGLEVFQSIGDDAIDWAVQEA